MVLALGDGAACDIQESGELGVRPSRKAFRNVAWR